MNGVKGAELFPADALLQKMMTNKRGDDVKRGELFRGVLFCKR